MCLIFSLIPATVLLIIAYFVFYSSSKVEGATRTFGKILAIWVFVVALFFPLGGAYMTLSGKCPMGKFPTGKCPMGKCPTQESMTKTEMPRGE